MFFLGLFFFIAFLLGGALFYLFACYVLCRVGRKFGVGNYFGFVVPIYNVYLLCRCAGLSGWFVLGILAPGVVTFLLFFLQWIFLLPLVPLMPIAGLVSFASCAYLWGTIAQRLGKNALLWGLATPLLFFLPVLVLAFDDSSFAGASRGGYIDV